MCRRLRGWWQTCSNPDCRALPEGSVHTQTANYVSTQRRQGRVLAWPWCVGSRAVGGWAAHMNGLARCLTWKKQPGGAVHWSMESELTTGSICHHVADR